MGGEFLMGDKPMTLLLIEDDMNECNKFKKCVQTRTDVKLIGITDSDVQGLEHVRNSLPEGIILDLELNKGTGNGTGLGFLAELRNIKLKIRPKIIVTTNVFSDSVYNYVHENGADLIFYKKQINYSVENVINTLLILRDYKSETINGKFEIESLQERKDMIIDKINAELDLIGVAAHLQGRKYLCDAIEYILEENKQEKRITVVQYLVNKYKRSNSTISRAMQNAILHAWRISSIEDLAVHYTAKINYDTGVPTPTEFMYYYANKIKKVI